MKEQHAFRLYPHGYTGNSLNELNNFLTNGWRIVLSFEEKYDENRFWVLILEKS